MLETKCGFSDGPAGKGQDLLVLHGPTLIVQIGFDPTFIPGKTDKPNLSSPGYWALVDTGATASCIDSGLAMQLKLPVIDRQKIGGVSGLKEVNMHLAQMHIPGLAFTIYGSFAGVDLIAGGQAHYALIGRTFLRSFRMTYEGDTGTVTISRPLISGV
jgi:hypothetical protein